MKKVIIFSIVILLTGCQTSKNFKTEICPKSDIPKLSNYDLNIDSLQRPDKLIFKFLTKDFEVTENPERAFYVALSENEFKKIVKLLNISKTQLEIIVEQKELINLYVLEINQLIDLIEQKDLKIQKLCENWEDSENNYREEVSSHLKTKIIGNTISGILVLIILFISL